jgi:hypothetical protein
MLIGIIALAARLLISLGDETRQSSSATSAEKAGQPDTGRPEKRASPSQSKQRPPLAPTRAPSALAPGDGAVSSELAEELKLTDAERDQVNILIAALEADRRQMFDEMSRQNRTPEEIAEEMGILRHGAKDKIRDLLGDKRADTLFDALLHVQKYSSSKK